MEGFLPTLVQFKEALSTWAGELVEVGRHLRPFLAKMFLVLCGGGLGAASRYGVGLLAARAWGVDFPWGTLAVNLAGCFLIGFLFALADRARIMTPDMRLFLITGYLGGLTTFSSFSLETVNAVRAGQGLRALANVLSNTAGGLALTILGMRLGGLK
ncbi:MAG: fluoride efflux transporter CrcB [Pseudomonadota bacterium]